MTSEPEAILIAGANGAGKTPFARQFLRVRYPAATFLNADEIQREHPAFASRGGRARAGEAGRGACAASEVVRGRDDPVEPQLRGQARELEGRGLPNQPPLHRTSVGGLRCSSRGSSGGRRRALRSRGRRAEAVREGVGPALDHLQASGRSVVPLAQRPTRFETCLLPPNLIRPTLNSKSCSRWRGGPIGMHSTDPGTSGPDATSPGMETAQAKATPLERTRRCPNRATMRRRDQMPRGAKADERDKAGPSAPVRSDLRAW